VNETDPSTPGSYRVRVSESRAMAETEGELSYLSPPQSAEDARALLRAVLNFDPPTERERTWQRPVAGGVRTVELMEVDDGR
jgi:hypothetical protein